MKYTIVTGASRGIGEAIAEYAGSRGFNLILSARNAEKLKETAEKLSKKYDIDVKVYAADLLEDYSVRDFYEWCRTNNLSVDKLINNAGVGKYGKFCDLPQEDQLDLIKLNQMATVKMVYTFLPLLQESGKGYILNVASTASYQPIPYMAVYAATQSFLLSFTRAVRNEMKGSSVSVSCLCPGPTATDFFERAGLKAIHVNSPEIKMTASEVAETAIEGMLEGVAEIIPGTSNTFGAYFSKLLPNSWVVKTVSGLFAPKSA